jgi:hypothetical protein
LTSPPPNNTIKDYRMKSSIFLSLMAAACQLHAQETPQQQLQQLVKRYTQAQHDFAPERIDALVTRDFFEVSPVGEVDPREKVLGFYLPANKRDASEMEVSEPVAHVFGDSGAIMVRLSGTATVGGEKRSYAFRGGFVAAREDGKWKLVSVQYTGIRPPKPAAYSAVAGAAVAPTLVVVGSQDIKVLDTSVRTPDELFKLLAERNVGTIVLKTEESRDYETIGKIIYTAARAGIKIEKVDNR